MRRTHIAFLCLIFLALFALILSLVMWPKEEERRTSLQPQGYLVIETEAHCNYSREKDSLKKRCQAGLASRTTCEAEPSFCLTVARIQANINEEGEGARGFERYSCSHPVFISGEVDGLTVAFRDQCSIALPNLPASDEPQRG